jgi:hypothetical protein
MVTTEQIEKSYRSYLKSFRGKSTEWHIKNYDKHNEQFRAIARDELRKRKVPVSKLPWKPKQRNPYAYPWE